MPEAIQGPGPTREQVGAQFVIPAKVSVALHFVEMYERVHSPQVHPLDYTKTSEVAEDVFGIACKRAALQLLTGYFNGSIRFVPESMVVGMPHVQAGGDESGGVPVLP